MATDVGVVAAVTVAINIGLLRQEATLSAPGAVSPDGDGDYQRDFAALSPATWRCAIDRASVSPAKRQFSDTVIAQATHILRGRFHGGITMTTRVSWVDRAGTTHTANVLDVADTEGAGVETVILVTEIAP